MGESSSIFLILVNSELGLDLSSTRGFLGEGKAIVRSRFNWEDEETIDAATSTEPLDFMKGTPCSLFMIVIRFDDGAVAAAAAYGTLGKLWCWCCCSLWLFGSMPIFISFVRM